MNTGQTTQNNRHAVVIGASMAGLLAARVLSDHFEQVTLIERDRLPQTVAARKGVPQGQHLHALLAKGGDILAQLFPDLFESLTSDGAIRFTRADMKIYQSGAWNGRFPGAIQIYSQSRPFLEQYVRNFLAERGNVNFVQVCEVTQLRATEDRSRITGVSLLYRDGKQSEEELAADLVVDAGGRGSRTPKWLVSLGYDQVEESSMKVNVGYATRIFRLPDHLSLDWKMMMISPVPPHSRRSGAVSLIEGNRWIVTLVNMGQDYLPDDDDSFLEYARSLPQPDIYETIKEAEPLSPILIYRYSANRWRHYERMSRLPDGFIILGDALCSFNPAYGQGMTVAALEANTLDTCLRQQSQKTNTQRSYSALKIQKAITRAVEWPWQMATSVDRLYQEAQEKQTWSKSLLNRYMQRINQLTITNPLVADRFGEVMHLLKPPTVLFDPRVAFAVLKLELVSHRQKPGTPVVTEASSSAEYSSSTSAQSPV